MEQEKKTKDDRVVGVESTKDELGFPQPPSWLTDLTKTKLWTVIPDKQVDIKKTQPDFAGLVDKLVGKAKHDIGVAKNRGDGPTTSSGRLDQFNFSRAVSDLLSKSETTVPCSDSTHTESSPKEQISQARSRTPRKRQGNQDSSAFTTDEFGAVDCEFFDDEDDDDDEDNQCDNTHLAEENRPTADHGEYPDENYDGDNRKEFRNEEEPHVQPLTYPNNNFNSNNGHNRYPPREGVPTFHEGNDYFNHQRYQGSGPRMPGGLRNSGPGFSGGPRNTRPGFPGGPRNSGPGFPGGPRNSGPGFSGGPRFPAPGPSSPGDPRMRRGNGSAGFGNNFNAGFDDGPGFQDERRFGAAPFRPGFGDGPGYDEGDDTEFGEGFGGDDHQGPGFRGGPNFRPRGSFPAVERFGNGHGPGRDNFGPRFRGPRFPNEGPHDSRFGHASASWNVPGPSRPPPPRAPLLQGPRKPTMLGGPAGYPLSKPKFIIPDPPRKRKRYPTPPPPPDKPITKKTRTNRWSNTSDETEPTDERELVPPAELMSIQFNETPQETLPPPPPPEPTLIDYTTHPGQERLDRWLGIKAMELRPTLTHHSTTGTLSVNDARSLLLDGFKFLESLQKARDLDPDGTEAELLKEKLKGIMVFLDDGPVNNLAKQLADRRKKRSNRRERERAEKTATVERRELLHTTIDAERQAEQDRLLNIEREHQMRKNADKILCEVKKKLATCTKALNVLTNLKKLRDIRKKDSESKGFQVPDECNTKFETRLKETLEMLGRQHIAYTGEEQTLQVMLDTENAQTREKAREAFRERENKRRLRQRKRLLQSLFGEEYTGTSDDPFYPFYLYYTHAERDLDAFLHIRRDWDVYLVPDGTMYGNCIPPGWVQPSPPSNDTWASALTDT